ncbi:MAG: hypothetical protein R2856_03645 [Caldilineaceae bacterium]
MFLAMRSRLEEEAIVVFGRVELGAPQNIRIEDNRIEDNRIAHTSCEQVAHRRLPRAARPAYNQQRQRQERVTMPTFRADRKRTRRIDGFVRAVLSALVANIEHRTYFLACQR